MSTIVTNTGRFTGGYFVLNKIATESSFSEVGAFVVSGENSKGLLKAILKLISEATNYIKICSFLIDNKQVVESLKNQLKEGKISVFILTAVDDKKIKSDMLEEDETSEVSRSRHFEFINELVKSGAHLRASSSAHAKFVIKDGSEALLMTANLTEPSLNNNEKGKHPNDESGIILQERAEIKALERIFDSIFLYGTEFKKFINLSDKTQLISKNEVDIRKTDFPETGTNLLWSYEKSHHLIYENLLSAVASAEKSIKLSTYSIVDLNKLKELTDQFESFLTIKKGSLKIFCRAKNDHPELLAACKFLAELGIEIYGDMYNHSKGVSIDDKEGIIFTANIDGKHGLKSGFEVGYKIENSNSVFGNFNSFLSYQIESAPFVFSLNPDKSEVYNFYKQWYDEKEIRVKHSFPNSFEIKYRANAAYTKEFEDGITNHPVFYTVLSNPDKKDVQFEINGKVYLIETLNETTFAVTKKLQWSEIVKAEKYMLFYNKINLTSYES